MVVRGTGPKRKSSGTAPRRPERREEHLRLIYWFRRKLYRVSRPPQLDELQRRQQAMEQRLIYWQQELESYRRA